MFIKLGAELSNPEREIISKYLHKLCKLLTHILHSPILCLCFLCSVIWSRRSASCEDSCCTSFCVWSSCNKIVSIKGSYFYTRLSCRHHPPAPAASSTRSAPRPHPRLPGRWRAVSGTSPDTCPAHQLFFT